MRRNEEREPSELEKHAEITGRTEILKELLRSKERMPCTYGGGDFILTELQETKRGYKLFGRCLRTSQVREGFFETVSSWRRKLIKAGCPEPGYDWLGRYKCKYADGGLHEL